MSAVVSGGFTFTPRLTQCLETPGLTRATPAGQCLMKLRGYQDCAPYREVRTKHVTNNKDPEIDLECILSRIIKTLVLCCFLLLD